MKIIILGAGQVGATCRKLVGEFNEITVVDTDGERLHDLQDKLDLLVVHGHAGHPNVLRRAGAEDADMIIAVTSSDEVNMVACQVAYNLYNTPTKIARIRSEEYLKYKDKLFHHHEMPIDHFIAPEQLVTKYIRRLIDYGRVASTWICGRESFSGGSKSLLRRYAGWLCAFGLKRAHS